MDVSILRSWWATRQGFDGSLDRQTPAAILDRSGWARSVGGAAPYLTMWSRGGCSREVMDAAAAQCEIHEAGYPADSGGVLRQSLGGTTILGHVGSHHSACGRGVIDRVVKRAADPENTAKECQPESSGYPACRIGFATTPVGGATLPYLKQTQLAYAFADLSCYGASHEIDGAFTLDEAAGDAAAIADKLGWIRFPLIGHSMSGLVVQRMLQLVPERVTRVVARMPVPPAGVMKFSHQW